MAQVRERIDDTPTEVTISLFTGYAAYLPAEQLHVSGRARGGDRRDRTWACARRAISTAQMRLQGYATWELVQFLLNGVLFVLIGLQLPHVVDGLERLLAPAS